MMYVEGDSDSDSDSESERMQRQRRRRGDRHTMYGTTLELTICFRLLQVVMLSSTLLQFAYTHILSLIQSYIS